MSYLERVAPIVDQTISRLASQKFLADPISGEKYSRQTSIISSAYKRHGAILEFAIREGLRESNRHRVWKEDLFKVSRAADQIVGQQAEDAYRSTTLPYGESTRTLQIDMIVFDDANQTLRSYEIKRGNGAFDAGKIRSIRRDLNVTQVLLKSYGETFKLQPSHAEAKIIFYYGLRSIPKPYSLVGNELDEHFEFRSMIWWKPRIHTSVRDCTNCWIGFRRWALEGETMQNTSHAVMAQRIEPQDSLDNFPTPPWATRGLLEHVINDLGPFKRQTCLEPACGQGHMAKPLTEYFRQVRASDIHPYGYGAVADYLTTPIETGAVDWVITNPPFRLAEAFIKRSMIVARKGVAILARTVFIESVGRYREIFELTPPSRFAQFTERVPMVKGRLDRKASTATGYAWIVWEKDRNNEPRLMWVPPCRKSLERDADY